MWDTCNIDVNHDTIFLTHLTLLSGDCIFANWRTASTTKPCERVLPVWGMAGLMSCKTSWRGHNNPESVVIFIQKERIEFRALAFDANSMILVLRLAGESGNCLINHLQNQNTFMTMVLVCQRITTSTKEWRMKNECTMYVVARNIQPLPFSGQNFELNGSDVSLKRPPSPPKGPRNTCSAHESSGLSFLGWCVMVMAGLNSFLFHLNCVPVGTLLKQISKKKLIKYGRNSFNMCIRWCWKCATCSC